MTLNDKVICDDFTIMTGDKQAGWGVITIRFRSRASGEEKYARFDVYEECLLAARSPAWWPAFIMMMADAGFFIAPTQDARDVFFSAVLFPFAYPVQMEPLPEGAKIIEISTDRGEIKE